MVTTKIPEALTWANSDAQGISTREGVITAWPGSMPTQAQVDQWEVDYAAAIADKSLPAARATARFDTEQFADMKAILSVIADVTDTDVATVKTKFIAERKALE